MFDFCNMMDNYEERVVANFENGELVVDTAAVTDGTHPFETGITSPEYNSGKWIIVEAYDTKELAQAGHDRWVKIMTENPPNQLRDCQNAHISQLLDGELLVFNRKH